MPNPILEIRVVVASPGDVAAERDALSRVVDEINQTMGAEIGVAVRLLRWETGGPGFRGRGPQQLIDEILEIPKCDIFVGIFWKRFGTPVYDARSGTEHEFKAAYEAWRLRQRPQILFYFSEQPYSPKTRSEIEQWGQVIDFKQNFPKEGLWWPYPGPPEFENIVRRHLVQQVLRLSRPPVSSRSTPNPTETTSRRALFIGRVAELTRLQDFIIDEANVLIVIEGIAGIGKSSLARNLVGALSARGTPCLWHDCQPETTLDSVLWSISKWARQSDRELGIELDDAPDADVKRVNYLADVLERHSLLLFLDDYHLVRDAMLDQLLIALADRPSRTRAILVSRRRPNLLLRISAGAAIEEHLSTGLDQAACEVFLARIGVSVDSATAQKVWELTGRGHPKALQLFAHRAVRIPVHQLLGSLPVFRVDIVREWLNPLLQDLSENERTTLIDLSVFERPLPFSDLGRLLPDRESDNVIASLLDGFLVDPVSDGGFQIHPLVREFCTTLIEDPRSKHQWAAEYYHDKCGPLSDPDFARDWQVEALLAAWSHFIKAENQSAATEIVELLRPPLMNRGQYEQILQLVQETSPPDSSDADFFSINIARLRSLKGDVEGAREILTPLLSSNQIRTLREAILVMSTVLNEHGRATDAWKLLEVNRKHFAGAIPSRTKLRFLSRVVQSFIETREYDKALEWARHLTDVSEAAGDKIAGAIGLRQMAQSFLFQDKFDTALELTRISLDLFQTQGRARETAATRLQLAQILIAKGEEEQARVVLDDVLEAFTSFGDRMGMSKTRQYLRDLSKMPNSSSANLT